MDNLSKKVSLYKESLAKVAENRKRWNESTKQLIYDTLLKVQNSFDINWSVEKIEALTNLDEVNLHFNSEPSGLVETTENGTKHNYKHGGALVFTQAYNGQVFVIYTFPFIDEWVLQLEDKVIEKVVPEKITEEFILSHVCSFLDEMTNWENSVERIKIGFKPN